MNRNKLLVRPRYGGAALRAMQKGNNGERYTLSNENHTTLQESVKIASEIFPELRLKTPKKAPKFLLHSVAGLTEFGSKIKVRYKPKSL